MKQYLNFLKHILDFGEIKTNRTGINTLSIFDYTMKFSLINNTFPIITTKKIHFKSVVGELLWFLKGDINTQYLKNNNINIWNNWEDDNGNLGPIYGKQWRSWRQYDSSQSIDQIKKVIFDIKNNPNSRRLIVSAWNVAEIDKMALPPCHMIYQFYVSQNKYLSCKIIQRSADAFLGVPFNISSYALLLILIAQECSLKAKELIWTGGDCHIYKNHIYQVKKQLKKNILPLPKLLLKSKKSIFDYQIEDIILLNYNHHSSIKAPIAV